MTNTKPEWEEFFGRFDFVITKDRAEHDYPDQEEAEKRIKSFLKEAVKKAEKRGAERAVKYIEKNAEPSYYMANEPVEFKIRTNFLEAAKKV